MQNKHQIFFLVVGVPTSREGGVGVKPVGTKSQVCQRKYLCGSPNSDWWCWLMHVSINTTDWCWCIFNLDTKLEEFLFMHSEYLSSIFASVIEGYFLFSQFFHRIFRLEKAPGRECRWPKVHREQKHSPSRYKCFPKYIEGGSFLWNTLFPHIIFSI